MSFVRPREEDPQEHSQHSPTATAPELGISDLTDPPIPRPDLASVLEQAPSRSSVPVAVGVIDR